MRNLDLIWVRQQGGLTQAQAAELLNVHRTTFLSWEKGTTKTPLRKMREFEKLVGVIGSAPGVVARTLKYDADGFPAGFDRDRFNGDYEAEDGALQEIEGRDFIERDRERYRLLLTKLPGIDANKELAIYDAEIGRCKAAGIPLC
jgi:DNA-binding XRE family transcriptional regulator